MRKGTDAEVAAKRECVARHLAQGLYPVTGSDSISTRCVISPVSIYKWRKQPRFAARVEQLRQEARDAVKDLFVSDAHRRIALYNDQLLALLRLKEDRARAYADDPDVVGGRTGAVVKKRTVRREKGDDDAEVITVEINYDRALDAEIRDIARQAAIEMGQWSEKRELTGAGGTPLIPIRELVVDRSAENTGE